MTTINPELKLEFENFLAEMSNDYGNLDEVTKDDVEELIWQGFLFGLRKINDYPEAFKATCVHCGNGLTETSDGEIIWCHAVAKEEGWVWEFDSQTWACVDCAKGLKDDVT